MSPASQIPPELIERFISFLPDNPSLVRPLALVSRSWTVAAQNKLYRHVVISQKGQWPKLHSRLRMFPYLRTVVRTLDIQWHISYPPHAQRKNLQKLFPSLEKVQYHSTAVDLSLLPLLGAAAPQTLRLLDVYIRGWTSISALQTLFSVQNKWNKITLRCIWSSWGDHECIELGTLEVQSLVIIKGANHWHKQPLYVSILQGTTFNVLQRLDVHCTGAPDSNCFSDGLSGSHLNVSPCMSKTLAQIEDISIEECNATSTTMRGMQEMFAVACERKVVTMIVPAPASPSEYLPQSEWVQVEPGVWSSRI